ncbi:MAG: cysteine desulfurase [Bacilli bacterium]|nr:cysteine desulfurase [Bacilli bacterium]MBN2877219.1 cysteine desulfurase [Bacilli bacterium]
MIYLDYSATTPPDSRVLEAYQIFNQEYFGNPNSNHELGILAKHQIEKASKEIKEILRAENYEVIYTSGATEANNLALKGYALANQDKGKHIITSPYEHSSVTTVLNYLAKNGYEIDVLDTNKQGLVDLNELRNLLRSDTILVSIAMVNSELGIVQDFETIKEILSEHEHVVFHSDMTQAIGKLAIDLKGLDLVTLSAHKIYGLKGIGALLRKTSINLEPVIHGGKSNSFFRGGTPPAPLMNSLAVALRFAYKDFNKKIEHIKGLNEYLRDRLAEIKHCVINYKDGIPQILNVSFLDLAAEHMHHELSKRKIYVSTQTACNSENSFSHTVKRVTNSNERASTSIRISLSHLTKKQEIDEFIDACKEILNENR